MDGARDGLHRPGDAITTGSSLCRAVAGGWQAPRFARLSLNLHFGHETAVKWP